MGLLTTAKLAEKDAFHYLTALIRSKAQVAAAPEDWFPWNYEATLARGSAPPPSP